MPICLLNLPPLLKESCTLARHTGLHRRFAFVFWTPYPFTPALVLRRRFCLLSPGLPPH